MLDLEKLQQWLLYTPHGRYTLRNERAFYRNCVQNVFGYYSLQIGLPQINFLQGNKIPEHYILGHDIKCDLGFLPFQNNSLDLIVCPHVLEFCPNYPQILEECYRALIPSGKLIITSFNQNCLFRKFKNQHSTPAIKLESLKEQLQTLNYTINGGKFFGYLPPLNNARILSRLSWLDKVGDRWLPTYANNFGLIATKEVISPTPITPTRHTYIPDFDIALGTAKVSADIWYQQDTHGKDSPKREPCKQ